MYLAFNAMTVMTAYLLMVVLLNMSIVLMTDMYQNVVDSSQRQYSRMIFTNYMLNIPNDYYSSMDHVPMFLSVFMLPLLPFLIYYRSKTFNRRLNIIIYCIKLILPFLVLFIITKLILLPLVYLKVLWSIMMGNYTMPSYKQVRPRHWYWHLLCFLFLGPFYLLKRIFNDLQLFYQQSMQKIPENLNLIFNCELYDLFKNALIHFK